MWKKLKEWWENRKGVVLDFVLPTLDYAVDPLSQKLTSFGVPSDKAKPVAIATIAWVKEYLKRQL